MTPPPLKIMPKKVTGKTRTQCNVSKTTLFTPAGRVAAVRCTLYHGLGEAAVHASR